VRAETIFSYGGGKERKKGGRREEEGEKEATD